MDQRLATIILTVSLAMPAACALGESPDDAKTPAADRASEAANDESEGEKMRLRAAREHIKRLAMRTADEPSEEVAPVERPLLAYGEPARGNSHGTLWAFGAAGRPAAFIELFQASGNDAVWFQSLTRTGDRRVRLTSPDGKRWEPPADAIARSKLGNAPRPAENGPARLRQLKSLARRFAAHEIWDPDDSRFELRLLVQPVHRYEDAPHGIQDGAAFVFAHGTNPELIVLLEALGASVENARWHYSAFPSSSAETHLEIDGREVWSKPRAPGVAGRPIDDYWLFSLPVETGSPANSDGCSPSGDPKEARTP